MQHVNSQVEAAGRRRQGWALALLAFAHLIISLDYTIVFVALPDIGHALGFSAQTMQWVVSAYIVPYGGLLLLGGRSCDLLGRRRMFVLGLFLFAVASLAGGLAATPGLLIAARAAQGLGGAFLFPATLSLISTTFAEGRDRNHALSVWAGVGGSGMALGALLGGALTQWFGWEAVFFVNVPLAGLGIALALLLIEKDGPAARGHRFDLAGAVFGTAGTVLLVFALVQGPELGWMSPSIVASAVAAGLLLAVFVAVEARSRDPLMPLRLFANRNLSTGLAIILLFTATFGALLYFLSLYFQSVLGYGALTAGFAYLVPYSVIFVMSSMAGRLVTAWGVRATLLASLVLGATGMVLIGLAMAPDGSYVALLPGLVAYSASMGLTFTVMFSAATSGVPGHEQGIASGIASTCQQVGNAVGIAILVAIANAGTLGLEGEALRVATASGLKTVVHVAAAGAVCMVLIALNFRRSRHDMAAASIG